MKVVYLCENCKATYFAAAGKSGSCAKCGEPLKELEITSEEWEQMSVAEREAIINPSDEFTAFEPTEDDGFVSTDVLDKTGEESSLSKLASFGGKLAKSGGKALVNKFKEKRLGAVIIDEANHRFRIEGGESMKAEKNGITSKLIKGTLAVSTVGLSVLAEKGAKAGINAAKSLQWYDFSELVNYRVTMDNERQYQSSGSRVRLMKGLSIGGTKASSKNVTTSMDIIVSLDNLNSPSVRIPIITKPLGGSAFDNAVKYGEETKRGLQYIMSHR